MKNTKEEKKIRVCEYCGSPLIFTFRWAYKEYFCMNCGALGDIFMGKDVVLTPELRLKKKIIDKTWNALYKTHLLLPISRYKRRNCKLCDEGGEHNEHLTKREIRNGKIAQKILNKMIGIFN
jgi:hypothetical protein